jgi:glutamate-1-semialdehyde 2,1-aminomutase
VRFYDYSDAAFFQIDGAPPEMVNQRRAGFRQLACDLGRASASAAATERLEQGLSDAQFTKAYRVPFQFSRYVNEHLPAASMLAESDGVTVTDLDGHASYDLSGSYGVNVFGYDFYKSCIDAGVQRVRTLGPVLGAYHPLIQENVDWLRTISGLDEVSFHMSGTEAVMQAVRLARFHTRRSHLVRFAGAYHGWWDDVQPGVGNPRVPSDTYTLRELDERTLRVLRGRTDIACVLVNPIQSLHPNLAAPGDGTLVDSSRRAHAHREEYADWLRELRSICTSRGIALIFDDVFVGFRIALGGSQEYFGVRADMVTYGKTVGGGLPIGVLCGARSFMRRFDRDRPTDICFARGTFNAHPYVMASMNEFLRHLTRPAVRAAYAEIDAVWNARAARLNDVLAAEGLPVRMANMGSIWTTTYSTPSRYNWMLQFYLRAEGIRLSWVGTGRLIFSHNFTDRDFTAVSDRFVAAARRMNTDGWWWHEPSLTNQQIRFRLAREMTRALLGAARA